MTGSPPECRLRAGEPVELGPFRLATDGGVPTLPTRVTLEDDGEHLRARFECVDPDPWATIRERDGALWQEEVVELFVAPGSETPRVYFEFELNPLGVLFDARVSNPHGDRAGMVVDPGWHCVGLESAVELDSTAGLWRAELALPWRALAPTGALPRSWRLNFYRVERPRVPGEAREPGAARMPGEEDPVEYSAWSPTLATPADFHRPARFGFVTRIG